MTHITDKFKNNFEQIVNFEPSRCFDQQLWSVCRTYQDNFARLLRLIISKIIISLLEIVILISLFFENVANAFNLFFQGGGGGESKEEILLCQTISNSDIWFCWVVIFEMFLSITSQWLIC